jgi:hypothetical protein
VLVGRVIVLARIVAAWTTAFARYSFVEIPVQRHPQAAARSDLTIPIVRRAGTKGD